MDGTPKKERARTDATNGRTRSMISLGKNGANPMEVAAK
jgi:hypothetical protein